MLFATAKAHSRHDGAAALSQGVTMDDVFFAR